MALVAPSAQCSLIVRLCTLWTKLLRLSPRAGAAAKSRAQVGGAHLGSWPILSHRFCCTAAPARTCCGSNVSACASSRHSLRPRCRKPCSCAACPGLMMSLVVGSGCRGRSLFTLRLQTPRSAHKPSLCSTRAQHMLSMVSHVGKKQQSIQRRVVVTCSRRFACLLSCTSSTHPHKKPERKQPCNQAGHGDNCRIGSRVEPRLCWCRGAWGDGWHESGRRRWSGRGIRKTSPSLFAECASIAITVQKGGTCGGAAMCILNGARGGPVRAFRLCRN